MTRSLQLRCLGLCRGWRGLRVVVRGWRIGLVGALFEYVSFRVKYGVASMISREYMKCDCILTVWIYI